jgi:hypothetical protein
MCANAASTSPSASGSAEAQPLGHEPSERARAQQVVAPHLAQRVPLRADRVEEGAAARAARLEHARQGGEVALASRVAGEVARGELPGVAPGSVGGQGELVEDEGALAAIAHDAGLAQDPEVPRDARLGHAEHFHQLLHGQLFALEQGEDPQAGRIRERLEDLLEGVRAHISGNHHTVMRPPGPDRPGGSLAAAASASGRRAR